MNELPDVPRWVEAHGIANDPDHWRQKVGQGFALGHDDAKLIVVAGKVDGVSLAELARNWPAFTLLVDNEALAKASHRPYVRAVLHTLPDPGALPEGEGAAPLTSVEGVPADLAGELGWAMKHGKVWAAWLDGEPAAFAYAPWRSAKYFDVSIDVVQSARQLGLGTIVSAAMIRDEREAGREPVWAADEGNHASRRLAKRLGFVETDELWVCAPS